jgi:hypothetical protein
MISARQQAANERNAQKSTGPSTAEGRARSSRNATTHGLASREALLQSEDKHAFQQHMESFANEYRPQTDLEQFYVTQMAEAAWRLRRVRRFESAAFDGSPDPSSDETVDKLLKLSRYEAAIERSYYRALRELKNLYKERYNANQAAIEAYITAPITEITERTHFEPASQEFEPPHPDLQNDPIFQKLADRRAGIARMQG